MVPPEPRGLPFGGYLLHRQIARGGMADIWLADNAVGRPVVLKKIRTRLAGDPTFVEMFLREARVSMRLDHGNIAQVFDFGEVQGEYYLAMERVDGVSLHQLLAACQRQNLGIPFPVAAAVIARTASALSYAHQLADEEGQPLGIVHRDISPQNLMVSYEGHTKLVDFGIAKARSLQNLTRPGVARGKYQYFSPEQVRSRPLDGRSDVFACGVLLYELLTGRRPFDGELVEVLDAVVQGRFRRPRELDPTIPEELEGMVLTAMATRVEDRYQHAAELERDLSGWLRQRANHFTEDTVGAFLRWAMRESLAGPADFPEALGPWWRGTRPEPLGKIRRSPWLWVTAASALFGLLVGGAVILLQPPAPAPPMIDVWTPLAAPPPVVEAAPALRAAAPAAMTIENRDGAVVWRLPFGLVRRDPDALNLLWTGLLDPEQTHYLRVIPKGARMGRMGFVNVTVAFYFGERPDGSTVLGRVGEAPMAISGVRRLGFAFGDGGSIADNEGQLVIEVRRGRETTHLQLNPVLHVISPALEIPRLDLDYQQRYRVVLEQAPPGWKGRGVIVIGSTGVEKGLLAGVNFILAQEDWMTNRDLNEMLQVVTPEAPAEMTGLYHVLAVIPYEEEVEGEVVLRFEVMGPAGQAPGEPGEGG